MLGNAILGFREAVEAPTGALAGDRNSGAKGAIDLTVPSSYGIAIRKKAFQIFC